MTSYPTEFDSPELQFLLCGVSGRGSQQQKDLAADALARISSHKDLIRAACRHRMAPQTMDMLLQVDGTESTWVTQFQPLHKNCVLQGMLMKAELARIVTEFDSAGIPLLVLKGPAVEHQIYSPGHSRQYRDLDLFIQPELLAQGCQLLTELGYSGQITEFPMCARRRAERLIRHYKHMHCLRTVASQQIDVELHWRIGGTPRMFSQCDEQFWQQSDQVRIGNTIVKTLPPRELLIFLACHGGRHRWKRLSWLCDFARAVEKYFTDDWDAVMDRAAELALLPYLDLAFLLLQSHVPWMPLPDRVALALRQRSHRLSRVAGSCRHAMVAEELYYENQPLSALKWYFELDHCWSDRAHALWSVTAPTDDAIMNHSWWGANFSRLGQVVRRSLGISGAPRPGIPQQNSEQMTSSRAGVAGENSAGSPARESRRNAA